MDIQKNTLRYAGIGSRNTPPDILAIMMAIASHLYDAGYTLLSGGAEGADSAFEQGCNDKKEIYVPWKSFNGNIDGILPLYPDAFIIAEQIHPAWSRLTPPQQKLMARNSHQILGRDLKSPVDFVVCWTSDGCINQASRSYKTGGTGQAIALADKCNVPVFNLYHSNTLNSMVEYINNSIFCD